MTVVATFTVTLSFEGTVIASVDYTTTADTAAAGTDYTARSGTLTFAPGQLTRTIIVPVLADPEAAVDKSFHVALSNPVGCIIAGATSGECVISTSGGGGVDTYLDRFNWIYANLHDAANGYFGPPSGLKARTIPYHTPERICAEAPDWGHESVSETASFWVGLEAWKGLLSGSWTGYNAAWDSIETNYVPNATNQPVGAYLPSSPADYTPEGDTPNAYPTLGQPLAEKGTDGLYAELLATYGNPRIYLMHWIIDVDGVYGFHNGDGSTVAVAMNNYQRGLGESCFETIPFPCYEDFSFGMASYGYLPLFTQGTPLYPAADFPYSKQWRYTSAPDAEARAIQWAFWANKFATTAGVAASISASNVKAKKMGDYLRYCLMDKYFRQIGADRALGSTDEEPYLACHFLISWYVAWGGEIPETGAGTWSFRIGSSESHQGYQAPDIAYFMATGGGGFTPLSGSAGDIWLGSLYRQIEMLRWLQSPEGPIAGGVTNSWLGRYLTPTDGRQTAKFYGMFYTYSPVWHDPASNNWVGFQCWGLGRLADLFLEVADKSSELAIAIRPNVEIILNKWVKWVLGQVIVDADSFALPDTLSWTSATQVVGQTTTTPNLEGLYEYIPTLDWSGLGGDYAAFWNESTVPNPTLHCSVVATGEDLGVASSLALLLLHFAQAKRLMGKLDTALPGSAFTPRDAYLLAKALLDVIWDHYRDGIGITREETRADYGRMADPVYIPSNFNGTMPNGDSINPTTSTFVSIRSFNLTDPDWPQVQSYIDNPASAPPVFSYHRFWANAEYAMSCGAMHHYFDDL